MVSTTDEVITESAPVVIPKPIDMNNITDQDIERAQKMFQLGKKNLFLNKYDESVNNIGEACDIFSAKYGETDSRCGELYFFYGRALLELARVENTVLGNALNGVQEEAGEEEAAQIEAAKAASLNDSRYGNPDEVTEDEKKEISDKVIDALCSEEKEAAPAAEAEPMVTKKPEESAAPAAASSEAPTTSSGDAPKAEEEEEDGEDDEEDDESDDGEDVAAAEAKADLEDEDISNLQRAWEMFELAKLIFEKSWTSDDLALKNKRISECLCKLGEIGIEQELYEQACGDIAEAIRMQEEIESAQRDDRMLAETYYQLGLAQHFANKMAEARESFQRCINILQLRIDKLKGKMLAEAATASDEEKNSWRDEIADIESLLPEMNAKLEECQQEPQVNAALIKEAKEVFAAAAAEADKTAMVNGSSGEVKDITQLVKSKRKMAEPDATSKKTRLSGEQLEEEAPKEPEVVKEQEPPKPEPEVAKIPEAEAVKVPEPTSA